MASELAGSEQAVASDSQSTWRGALRVFGLGLVGVAGLAATVYLQVTLGAATVSGLSPAASAAATALQPAILLAVAAVVGSFAAPRVGLYSRAFGGSAGESQRSFVDEIRLAVPLGLAAGLAIVVLDVALAPLVAADLSGVASQPAAVDLTAATLASAPARFLYGGIAEEVLLRWGLLSALAWVGWRLAGRPGRPGSGLMWTAIVVAAVVFGVGHLPALAASVELTPVLVARTVALNAVGGIVFGWLYWRRSLEAAMVGHASSHVVLLGVALVSLP